MKKKWIAIAAVAAVAAAAVIICTVGKGGRVGGGREMGVELLETGRNL